jgi:hypothetical protein
MFALLKETSPYTGRPWARQSVEPGGLGWRPAELEQRRRALATDYALKESRLSSDEQILASVVLTLCGASRRAAA